MHIVECVFRKTLCSIKIYFHLKCCELSAVSLCVFKSMVKGSSYNSRLCFVICIMIVVACVWVGSRFMETPVVCFHFKA